MSTIFFRYPDWYKENWIGGVFYNEICWYPCSFYFGMVKMINIKRFPLLMTQCEPADAIWWHDIDLSQHWLISIIKISMKIIHVINHANLPESNELTCDRIYIIFEGSLVGSFFDHSNSPFWYVLFTMAWIKHDWLILNHLSILYSIMMLMKFSDLSQSNLSNWVMWQVKDPCPRPGWDGCLTREKMAFIKSVKNLDNIAVYLIASFKSKWKINK